MNYSCADFSFPLLDRKQSLALIRLLGFSHVDIGLFARSGHFSPAELCSSPTAYMATVQEDLRRESLSCSDVFLQIGVEPPEFAANDPDIDVRHRNRDVFRRAVDFGLSLQCNHLTGLPGVFHREQSPESDWRLAIEEAYWRTQICATAGIAYSIEPHLGSICDTIPATLKFLDAVPGLTLTLDYGHFIHAGVPSDAVDVLVPYALHLHARCGARNRLQVPFTENEIDFRSMISALARGNYGGYIALEYVWIDWNDCNRTDNVSETLLLWRALEEMSTTG